MAMCETAMVDAALLAVEEINSRGGLLGRPLQAIIADGESDPAVFRNQARKLVRSDKAQALFGCWTSSARKAVRTVVEEEDSLLWYPVQYEGLEQSPNIVYTANGHGKGALSSGAAGFMGKPYQLKELAVVVRRVLDEKEPGPRPE